MPEIDHRQSVPGVARSGMADAEAPSHRIVPEDNFTLSELGALSLSPEGRWLAYRDSCWEEGRKVHRVMVLGVETKEGRCVARLGVQPFAPQWIRGTETVCFAADFEGEGKESGVQVWRAGPAEGELAPVTEVPGGISRFVIGAGGSALYFTRHVPSHLDGWSELRSRYGPPVELGQGKRRLTELWCQDLVTGERRLLRAHDRFITSFSVSPDEKTIALVTAPDERLIINEGEATLELLEPGTGTITTLPDDLWRNGQCPPFGWIELPAWSPDSRKIAFRVAHDAYPAEIMVADMSGENPTVMRIPRPLECYPLRVGWQGCGRLLFNASHRTSVVLVSLDPARPDEFSILVEGEVAVNEFAVASDCDRVAVLKAAPKALPEIFLVEDQEEAITSVHAHTADWDFPSLSRFEWTAPDGTPLEGVLELPPGYEWGSRPLPLVVNIHGGPSMAAELKREFGIRGHTALAAKGYAVFQPNYRGSTGYGDSFLTALVGRTNDVEVGDILSGVDALIEAGVADGERLGMMGWSYGGYVVNCLLLTGRFKAASSGAGTVNMTSQFGEMDTPGHTINLLEGLPWEDPARYQRASPIYGLRPGIRTATLIHAGGDDCRVPSSQGRTLYRALQHYLDAPCELLVYPGAGHRLDRYEHQLARIMWDHAWFEKYLG